MTRLVTYPLIGRARQPSRHPLERSPAGDALDRFWDAAEYVPSGLVHPTLIAPQALSGQGRVAFGSFEDCSLQSTGAFLHYL